ncbi:uncharacterized protein haf isoform X2 [Palaemon carinicauda]|uniref:uncharacterized protein haf isoform X2 n=1 Tax=Palaemon carinicauda TaxID=392227 RepID=UPI0035B5CE47
MTSILRSRTTKSHFPPKGSNMASSTNNRSIPSRNCRAMQYLVFILLGTTVVRAQCPWPREVTDLNASCLCAYNMQNELSIQCTSVNFTLLMTVLHQRANSVPLDLLYVNNTRINVLNDRTFDGLKVENIQFSSCDIYNISDNAFRGLENSLKNLNLQDNKLSSVPSGAISKLRRLVLLDLSGNQITSVPEEAFKGSRLATLKLADNDLSLSFGAFLGIERTLKNLNLKGTKLRSIPTAILNLPVLAFLDVAQNEIGELQPGSLKNLHSLTALNMERNSLQRLDANNFEGVNDTLSSLSLLNNHITDFPTEALNTLSELRVLDIGFNMITKIPDDAFHGVRSLTLLALDGNPINTVPLQAFKHLNTTLRGFSVGGKFLHCDCRVAWITEWIRDYDLQVTSRERNPQFCGQPSEYRDRSFFQLGPSELVCDTADGANPERTLSTLDPLIPPPVTTTTTTTTEALLKTTESTTITTPFIPTTRQTPSSPKPQVTSPEPPRVTSSGPGTIIQPQSAEESGVGSVGSVQRGPGGQSSSRSRPTLDVPPQIPPTRSQQRPSRIERPLSQPVPSTVNKRPNLVIRQPDEPSGHSDDFFGLKTQGPYVEEVIVQEAYRKDNSVIIQWDSEVSNILGFRVVYRLFGDKNFKLGPPLASSEREFKIKNVPAQECVVVCVVSLEDVNVTPNNVLHSQCREIRTDTSAAMHMDTIIIAASAAICGTVIIAVIVFICCNRKRSGHREKDGIPAVLSPSSPPLASLGTLETGTLGGGYKGEGDNISMFSHRSIPRARMYHMDKDGQSQRSYSALSAANLRYAPSFSHGLGLSRQDLSISRQSLAASQLSGADFSTGMAVNPNAFGHGMGGLSRMASQRSDRRRQRSKSRERASSRLSHAGSSHSLTGYDTDGWTDHDMDIYMARNPTRGGLVQL